MSCTKCQNQAADVISQLGVPKSAIPTIFAREGADTGSDIKEYPSLTWIKSKLRWSRPRIRYQVQAVYIVGSEAKGTSTPDSDLDVALIIPPVRGKTSLQVSQAYHSQFRSNAAMPHWNGRRVDFQFFYADDPELEDYTKIAISK